MSTSIIFEKLLLLPQIDFGKIWSWLKVQPTRPNSAENTAQIVGSVWRNPQLDHMPEGFVFRLPDNRFFVALVEESSSEMRMSYIRQVLNPPSTLNAKGTIKNDYALDTLGTLGDQCDDRNVQRLLVAAYYGKRTPQALQKFALA